MTAPYYHAQRRWTRQISIRQPSQVSWIDGKTRIAISLAHMLVDSHSVRPLKAWLSVFLRSIFSNTASISPFQIWWCVDKDYCYVQPIDLAFACHWPASQAAVGDIEGDLNTAVSSDEFVSALTDAGMANSSMLRDLHKIIVHVAKNEGVEEGKVNKLGTQWRISPASQLSFTMACIDIYVANDMQVSWQLWLILEGVYSRIGKFIAVCSRTWFHCSFFFDSLSD